MQWFFHLDYSNGSGSFSDQSLTWLIKLLLIDVETVDLDEGKPLKLKQYPTMIKLKVFSCSIRRRRIPQKWALKSHEHSLNHLIKKSRCWTLFQCSKNYLSGSIPLFQVAHLVKGWSVRQESYWTREEADWTTKLMSKINK